MIVLYPFYVGYATQFLGLILTVGTRIGLYKRYIEPVVICIWSFRHGLAPARSGRPDGRPAEAGRRLSPRDLHPPARQGADPGARFSHPLSQGRLYELRRKLARIAWRRHRVHDAATTQRGLAWLPSGGPVSPVVVPTLYKY